MELTNLLNLKYESFKFRYYYLLVKEHVDDRVAKTGTEIKNDKI